MNRALHHWSSSSSATLLIVAVWCLLITATIGIEASSSKFVNLFTTRASLLSGDLESCATGNTARCGSSGIAEADAIIRNYTNTTGETEIIMQKDLDRTSAFAQAHPLNWGINRKVLTQIFNYTKLFGSVHSVLTDTSRNMTYLRDANFPFLISNALIPPSNPWIAYTRTVYFDPETRLALIGIFSGTQTNSYDSLRAIVGALTIVAERTDGPWYPVVEYGDNGLALDTFVKFATDRNNVPKVPAAILDFTLEVSDEPATLINGMTWLVKYDPGSEDMQQFRFEIGPNTPSTGVFKSVTHKEYPLRSIDAALKDPYYHQKQHELQQDAAIASANDPVVGKSGFMPLTREGDFRRCSGGECPLGNLFTDSYIWKTGADVAFENSGGIRGPGWPAGDVTVSDLYAALPFVNTLCTGKISGVSLFKIMNYSINFATFNMSYLPGDELLHVSGMRVTYNLDLPNPRRLVNIEVWDKTTRQYEPLERLRLYTYVTNSYVCKTKDPFPEWFNSQEIEGETIGVLEDEAVQTILADYLTFLLPKAYDTSIQGRLVNDTSASATTMKSPIQTIDSCEQNTFWREPIKTCVPCAAGFVNPRPQDPQAECVPATKETNILPIVLGIVLPVAFIIVVLLILYFWYLDKNLRDKVRDTENAPKNSGDLIAIIFTDIQGSTALWSTAPLSMSTALETHNKIVNEVIAHYNGYYVKSQGDSFFIAYDCTRDEEIEGCTGAQVAAKICLEVQRRILEATYPSAINKIYNAVSDDELLEVQDDPNDLVPFQSGQVWNGLRLRIGLAIGTCEVKFDEVAKSYDYFGPLVNLAARTEASGIGGQILVCEEASAHIDYEALECTLTSAGRFELKGIPEPVHLMQLMSLDLIDRNTHFERVREKEKIEGGSDGKSLLLGDENMENSNDRPGGDIILNDKNGSDATQKFIEANAGDGEQQSPPGSERGLHGASINLNDVFSDGGSEIFDHHNNNSNNNHPSAHQFREDAMFLQAALRAVRTKDKKTVMQILETAWRVKNELDMSKVTTDQERLASLAKKISSMKHWMMRQAARRRAKMNGSNSNLNSAQEMALKPPTSILTRENSINGGGSPSSSSHHNHKHNTSNKSGSGKRHHSIIGSLTNYPSSSNNQSLQASGDMTHHLNATNVPRSHNNSTLLSMGLQAVIPPPLGHSKAASPHGLEHLTINVNNTMQNNNNNNRRLSTDMSERNSPNSIIPPPARTNGTAAASNSKDIHANIISNPVVTVLSPTTTTTHMPTFSRRDAENNNQTHNQHLGRNVTLPPIINNNNNNHNPLLPPATNINPASSSSGNSPASVLNHQQQQQHNHFNDGVSPVNNRPPLPKRPSSATKLSPGGSGRRQQQGPTQSMMMMTSSGRRNNNNNGQNNNRNGMSSSMMNSGNNSNNNLQNYNGGHHGVRPSSATPLPSN